MAMNSKDRLDFLIDHGFTVTRMTDTRMFMLLDQHGYPVTGDEWENAYDAIDGAMEAEWAL
jgi:hypothetical protein